jgi:hypothetical protein
LPFSTLEESSTTSGAILHPSEASIHPSLTLEQSRFPEKSKTTRAKPNRFGISDDDWLLGGSGR